MHPQILPLPVSTSCFSHGELQLPWSWPSECSDQQNAEEMHMGLLSSGLQGTDKLHFFLLATFALGHHPSKLSHQARRGAQATQSSHLNENLGQQLTAPGEIPSTARINGQPHARPALMCRLNSVPRWLQPQPTSRGETTQLIRGDLHNPERE